MGWCDPCAAEPLSGQELADLGARWIARNDAARDRQAGGAQNAFVTRLHVRYDAKSFPEDLIFTETRDRENFQGRYVLRHPWTGETACGARGAEYTRSLEPRFAQEARNLANLTGWSLADIQARMAQTGQAAPRR